MFHLYNIELSEPNVFLEKPNDERFRPFGFIRVSWSVAQRQLVIMAFHKLIRSEKSRGRKNHRH